MSDTLYLARLTHTVGAINHLAALQLLTTDPVQRAKIAALGLALGELIRPAAGLTEQVQP